MSPSPSTTRRGHRTLVEALDELVAYTPRRVYASVPRADDLTQGFDDVYAEDVGHAVDRCAHWLLRRCGGSRDDFETIAYVGINDLRYTMMFFAAIKCGKKAMFLSPKNTVAQNTSLLKSTACKRFYHSPELSEVAVGLKSVSPELETTEIAPFDKWVAAYDNPFIFSKPYEEAKWDPILTLHSSGSTGNPKPITINNGYVAANLERKLPDVPGRQAPGHRIYDFEGGGKFFATLAPFHLAGVMAMSYYPVFAMEATVVMGPARRPVTGQDVKHVMDQVPIKVLFAVPTYIEHVASLPGGIEQLSTLDYLMFSGGPLAPIVGNQLAEVVQIASFYGTGELGLVPFVMPRREDWEWLEIHPSFAPDMEPDGLGFFELVLRKTGDPTVDEMRGTYWTEPDTPEWRTKDLFVPHPTKPNLWRFQGRKDDTIVLSTGEKWNPVPSENIVLGCPKLSGCLAVGSGRPEPAILLEPRHDSESSDELIRSVQPFIDEANSKVQGHGKIFKVAVLEPGSLVRAPKGTVVRKLSTDKLHGVIESLYAT